MTSKPSLLSKLLLLLHFVVLAQSSSSVSVKETKVVYSSDSKKLLLINDVHLNLESNLAYSEPGSEATPELLKNVL